MREMKDSGIKGINHIPKEYKPSKLKYVADIYGRIGFRGYTQQDLVDEGEGPISLSPSNFNNTKMNFEKCSFLTWEKYYESPEIMIHNGDILFVKTGSSYGKNCYVDDLPMECTINPQLVVIKNTKINSKWLSYFLQTKHIENLSELAVVGGTIPTMSQEKIGNFTIIIPPKEEQEKIVDYLDIKCTEIDKISTDLQHQIELLQEYKQSVITEAVTKGLDKNVAMKDSAIEWIGDIPHTWNIYRLKYIIKSSLQYGANESGLEYTDELPRYVRITDIDNNGRLKDTDKQSLDLHTAKPYLLDSNDILLARSGATVGKAFLYHESDGPCAFAGYLIRAKCKTELLSKLVYYYTMSYSYNDWKNSIFSQATIPNIGADKYSNLRIPISPNEKEQRKIIDYLDQKCAEIDAVLTDKQKQLDTLTEYKKSLIYEYVTGKKEVPADA